MRLYLTKAEAKRIVSAIYQTTDMSEKDMKLVTRIERCMEVQKPVHNPPDEAGR